MNSEEIGRYEHHKLVRESPEYRNFLMLEELRAEMQLPLYREDIQEEVKRVTPDKDDIHRLQAGHNFLYKKIIELEKGKPTNKDIYIYNTISKENAPMPEERKSVPKSP